MSKLVPPQDLQPHIQKLISAKKQIGNMAVDLTLGRLFKIKRGGWVDFGGSEWQEASVNPVPTVKMHPQDVYGWWELSPDLYLCQFNETLRLGEKQIGFLQPHPRLVQSGATLGSRWVKSIDDSLRVILLIPRAGIRLKENARIAQLLVWELEEPAG